MRPDGSNPVDLTNADAEHVAQLLTAIPGAYERTQEGIEEARRSEGVPLDAIPPGS